MIDAGILDGDYVVVQKQQTARDGDIVVALAGEDEAADEATVGFATERAYPARPENETLEPLWPPTSRSRQGDRGLQAGLMTEIVALNRTLDQGSWRSCEARASSACLQRVRPPHGAGRSSARSAGRFEAGAQSGLQFTVQAG